MSGVLGWALERSVWCIWKWCGRLGPSSQFPAHQQVSVDGNRSYRNITCAVRHRSPTFWLDRTDRLRNFEPAGRQSHRGVIPKARIYAFLPSVRYWDTLTPTKKKRNCRYSADFIRGGNLLSLRSYAPVIEFLLCLSKPLFYACYPCSVTNLSLCDPGVA